MAWIDASSVKLGCIGFSKNKQSHLIHEHRRSGFSWIAAKDVCKKANPKAHLIEIFNDNQSRFLMSEKVRKQVLSHIGIDTFAGKVVYTLALSLYPSAINYLTRSIVGWWWIGAQLKSGTWYWEHSKKPVTYWSRIGCDNYGTDMDLPYGCVNLSNFTKEVACFCRATGEVNYLPPICQI